MAAKEFLGKENPYHSFELTGVSITAIVRVILSGIVGEVRVQ